MSLINGCLDKVPTDLQVYITHFLSVNDVLNGLALSNSHFRKIKSKIPCQVVFNPDDYNEKSFTHLDKFSISLLKIEEPRDDVKESFISRLNSAIRESKRLTNITLKGSNKFLNRIFSGSLNNLNNGCINSSTRAISIQEVKQEVKQELVQQVNPNTRSPLQTFLELLPSLKILIIDQVSNVLDCSKLVNLDKICISLNALAKLQNFAHIDRINIWYSGYQLDKLYTIFGNLNSDAKFYYNFYTYDQPDYRQGFGEIFKTKLDSCLTFGICSPIESDHTPYIIGPIFSRASNQSSDYINRVEILLHKDEDYKDQGWFKSLVKLFSQHGFKEEIK